MWCLIPDANLSQEVEVGNQPNRNETNMKNKDQTIQAALIKYPKARRIAVENVSTWYRGTWDDALNLRRDARSYKWNSDTIKAINYVYLKLTVAAAKAAKLAAAV